MGAEPSPPPARFFLSPEEDTMPKDPRHHEHPENDKQLGNPEPAKAHWPKDLELHPGRDDDEDEPHRRKPDSGKHH